MSRHRWWWRAAVAALLGVAGVVAGDLFGLDPHPGRTLLVVVLLVALSGLLADSIVDPPPEWRPEHPVREDWRGHDPRTGFYVRMLESHLTARSGDPVVRDRLVRLAEQTLRTRHGVAPGTAEAGPRLGPELASLAAQPPSRMTREELDRIIGRIERL
ncbi:MAG: hypothetical protein M3237_21585 [Actinomycetota bacterium]|nr:hypothetical protein [Actinomycetota bacterium]